jgi:histidyl-tRNA synthetase
MIINNPKGTQDFLPPQSTQKSYLEAQFRKIVSLYGFSEIVTPTFEHTELYLRSTGLSTDIVTKQMYNFVDKGNRQLTLRPEGTPGVVRAFLQYNLKLPQRLFYIGPMFRYERPQKGRYREFYQLGVEVLGESWAETDVELVEMALHFFKNIGLNEILVKINSVGCSLCRPKFRNHLKEFLEKKLNLLCADCQVRTEQNPLRVFDCKEASCREIYEEAPKITDYLCTDCERHFQKVLEGLSEIRIPFELDKTLVRGLDYYTKTTFEFIPTIKTELGSQDSIGGGGRYDNLVEDFGGSKTPAIGFALGLERILLCLSTPSQWRALFFILPLDEESFKHGKELIRKLRAEEIPALLSGPVKNLRTGLSVANTLFYKYVIIIGGNELKRGIYTVKNLQTYTQIEISQKEGLERLKELLSKE